MPQGRIMQVASRMTPNPVTIAPRDSLAEAQERMRTGRFRRLPVVDDGKLVGIVSDRDLRQHWGHLGETRVTAAMTDEVVTVAADAALEEAARIMLARKVGGVPVVEAGRLVGIITASDLLGAFLELVTDGRLAVR